MPAIDQNVVGGFVHTGAHATTTTAQGNALEDLVCYLFGLVPGITISQRNVMNAFSTEEIDVAFWNEAPPDGFHFFPNVILVECKNWSSRVGSNEVSWFDSKLRSRGLDFGILIAAKGITGDATDLTNAHSIVARALAEKRRLIVLKTSELLTLNNTDELLLLIKRKLCELAVMGAIS